MFEKNIKYYRKQRKLTQEQLAHAMNKKYDLVLTKGTVSRWEKGTEPNARNILYLSDFFSVTLAKLLGMEGATDVDGAEMVNIKILGGISCGDPMREEEHLHGYRGEYKNELPGGDLFYLETKGDSMSPTIPAGSQVLIRVQQDVEDGEIAVCLVNEGTEATLKRVKKYDDYYLLMSDNHVYDPIVSNRKNPVKIIGKAVRLTKDL